MSDDDLVASINLENIYECNETTQNKKKQERFSKFGQKDVDELLDNVQAKNTKYKRTYAVNIFKEWSKLRQIQLELHEMDGETLDKNLRLFYCEVKNREGEDLRKAKNTRLVVRVLLAFLKSHNIPACLDQAIQTRKPLGISLRGTFLGNCEYDRMTHRVREETVSLWMYLNNPDILKSMLNPVYELNEAVLRPSAAAQSLTVWSGVFLRGRVDPKVDEQVWNEVRNIQSRNKELKTKAVELRREYVELQAKVRSKLKTDRRTDNSMKAFQS